MNWILARMCKNTNRTYSPYVRQFSQWCADNKKGAFPASPVTVAAFLIHLNDNRKLAVNTINVAASAISSQYRFAHTTSPTLDPLVRMTKKIIAQVGTPAKQKLPLTVEMATAIATRHRNDTSFVGTRNAFMVIVAMASFCRESEITNLEAGDVWVDTLQTSTGLTEALFLYIQQSKTVHDRIGYTVIVPKGSSEAVCPLAWFRKYAKIRSDTASHFFHSAFTPYERLNHQTPNHIVKNELEAIGIDPTNYGSHSCRSGGVSEAVEKGDCATHLLKRHGHWKSDAIFNYIRDSWEKQLKVRVF